MVSSRAGEGGGKASKCRSAGGPCGSPEEVAGPGQVRAVAEAGPWQACEAGIGTRCRLWVALGGLVSP